MAQIFLRIRWLYRLDCWVLIAFVITASGCGFRFQPIVWTPQGEQLWVESAVPDSQLVAELNETLKVGGVPVAELPDMADYVLRIEEFDLFDRINILDNTATVVEYELQADLEFQLRHKDAGLIHRATLTATRFYTHNRFNPLSESNERLVVETELRSHLIRRLVDSVNLIASAREDHEN